MMSETYVECLVKKKTSSGMMFLRMLTIAMAVAFLFAGLFLFILPALLVGLAMAVAAYFVYMNTDLEYEYLYLEQHTGRAKRVVLTVKGKDFAKETVGKIHEAEIQAFGTWTEEEISTYIHLMEKYTHCFRKQIEKM